MTSIRSLRAAGRRPPFTLFSALSGQASCDLANCVLRAPRWGPGPAGGLRRRVSGPRVGQAATVAASSESSSGIRSTSTTTPTTSPASERPTQTGQVPSPVVPKAASSPSEGGVEAEDSVFSEQAEVVVGPTGHLPTRGRALADKHTDGRGGGTCDFAPRTLATPSVAGLRLLQYVLPRRDGDRDVRPVARSRQPRRLSPSSRPATSAYRPPATAGPVVHTACPAAIGPDRLVVRSPPSYGGSSRWRASTDTLRKCPSHLRSRTSWGCSPAAAPGLDAVGDSTTLLLQHRGELLAERRSAPFPHGSRPGPGRVTIPESRCVPCARRPASPVSSPA